MKKYTTYRHQSMHDEFNFKTKDGVIHRIEESEQLLPLIKDMKKGCLFDAEELIEPIFYICCQMQSSQNDDCISYLEMEENLIKVDDLEDFTDHIRDISEAVNNYEHHGLIITFKDGEPIHGVRIDNDDDSLFSLYFLYDSKEKRMEVKMECSEDLEKEIERYNDYEEDGDKIICTNHDDWIEALQEEGDIKDDVLVIEMIDMQSKYKELTPIQALPYFEKGMTASFISTGMLHKGGSIYEMEVSQTDICSDVIGNTIEEKENLLLRYLSDELNDEVYYMNLKPDDEKVRLATFGVNEIDEKNEEVRYLLVDKR